MIKFLHAADLHLDSPFHGLSPEKAAQRRQEQRQMLTDLADLICSEKCDLVLLAGDLFDSENAFPETVEALCRALGSMDARVFISPGNHDHLCGGSPYFTANWPKNVHIFKENTISSVVIPELGCTVYGAGFGGSHCPKLLEGFRAEDDSTVNFMVLHGDAETAQSPYNPMTEAEISQSGLDYLALGHIHAKKLPKKAGKTLYGWPGCPMGRGFDELGEKGVFLGTADDDGVTASFFPLPGRRYEILEVAVGDDAASAIREALSPNTEQDIYRIRLVGSAEEVDLRALRAEFEHRFYALQLRDETVAKRDIWLSAGEDTLKGQFLEILQKQAESAAGEEKAMLLMAARLGLAAMEGREEDAV